MILQLKLVSAWYGERLGTTLSPPPISLSLSRPRPGESVCSCRAEHANSYLYFFLAEHPASSYPTFSTVNESSTDFQTPFPLSTHTHTHTHGDRKTPDDFVCSLTDAKFNGSFFSFFFYGGWIVILDATFWENWRCLARRIVFDERLKFEII